MRKNFFILFTLLLISFNQPTYASSLPAPSINFHINMQDWENVDKLIPRKSTFTVIDVESGQSFQVQRRAGSSHADVQPVTRKDTKVMKKIYKGRWSWKRRAVLILTKDNLIPASMHGMPHGAGAIQNGFPGHFCIHFSGSTTHKTKKPDLSHHVMILKAAGKIETYMNHLPAADLLNVLLVLIKNGDSHLAKKWVISNQEDLQKDLRKIEKIEAMQWTIPIEGDPFTNSLEANIPVEVKLYIKNQGETKVQVTFTMIRTSPISSWKVNIDPLLKTID